MWNKIWSCTSATPYASLAIRIGFALLMGTLSRFIFWAENISYFNMQWTDVLYAFFGGVYFDVSSLFWLNLPFIVMCIIPLPWRYTKPYRIVSDVLYIGINSFCWLLNLGDTAYFPFALKRSTFALLTPEGMNREIASTILSGSLDFPFLLASAIIGIFLFVWVCRKTVWTAPKSRRYIISTVSFIAVVLIWVLGSRGGFRYKPLGVLDAALYAQNSQSAVVLSTPFVMMKTVNRKGVPSRKDFSIKEQQSIFTSSYRPKSSALLPIKGKADRPTNVVLLIVESLSQEYCCDTQYTPFINSLAKQSISFKGYANGSHSIESLPALLSALPPLMDDPFVSSVYASNKIDGLPIYLRALGYHSYFFHGGNNGTMRFDSFANQIGFDKYFGRNEYGKNKDYDGKGGVFDEPYLQYVKNKIGDMSSPFFTCVYTLSSHHPYTIPEKYKGRFPKGEIPILEAIAYTDYSLKCFFEAASKEPWFANTLFVITADHAAQAYTPYFSDPIEQYSVPFIFYQAGVTDSIKAHYYQDLLSSPVQAIDLMPSILHYVGYWNKVDSPVKSFGSSMFDTSAHKFAVHYQSGQYTFVDGKGSYIITTRAAEAKEKQDAHLRFCFAFVQEYINSMNENNYYTKTK